MNNQQTQTDNDGKFTYHWGHWVFSDTPTTGVIGVNSLEWIGEETDYHAVCNTTYESYMEYGLEEKIAEWQQDQDDAMATPGEDMLEEWRDELGEYYEGQDEEFLIGDYILDEASGQYIIDYDGTNHYAAIVDYGWGGGVLSMLSGQDTSHAPR